MSELSGRQLTYAYGGALAVIALMSLGSHVTLGRVLTAHEGSASVINVAGRQRMLSQRIAGLVAERELGVSVDDDLATAIDRFEQAHHALILGDSAQNLQPAAAPALRDIYFGGERPLDAAVAGFVARARRIAALPPDDAEGRREAGRRTPEARKPILTSLNDVVSVHQSMSDEQLGRLRGLQTASLLVVILTLVLEALLIFRPMVRRIARYTQTLLKISATDPLTGALNRRSFTERAGAELSRARRYGRPTSLLMIDADRFKSVNDRYGHAGGDAVLRAFVATVADCLRPSDLLGRIGGEEFAVLLAETGVAGAESVAERIRAAVEARDVPMDGQVIRFTVSLGAAALGDGPTALENAMERADAALYRAKELGRNRVVVGAPPASAELSVASPALAAA